MVLLALLAVALAGCRLEVVAEVELEADGSGTAAVDLHLDRELLAATDELDLDPVGTIRDVVDRTAGWEVEVGAPEGDDGLRVLVEHAGDDPLGALAELAAGLAPHDPGLRADLDLVVAEDGSMALDGEAALTGPGAPGVTDAGGEPVRGPGREELERLVADHVTGALVVTLPGPVTAHDADERDGRTLRWVLPPDDTVEVRARAGPAPSLPPALVVSATGAALLALGALLGLAWRRRRRRRLAA